VRGDFFLRDSTGRHSIIIACTEKERESVRERRKSYRLRCLFLFVGGFFLSGLWTFGFGWENWKGGWVGLGERVGMEWDGMGFRVLACLLISAIFLALFFFFSELSFYFF